MTESAHLSGLAVAVTRPEAPDGPLSEELRRRGAEVLSWFSIRIEPPHDTTELDRAARSLHRYDWIVFTSARAARALAERCARVPEPPRIAAVGEATAAAVAEAGWDVALVAPGPGSDALVEALAEALPERSLRGARVLFPVSGRAGSALTEGLERLGARVHRVTAYRTELAPLDPEPCRRSLDSGGVHAVTFASPSAVNGLRAALGQELFDRVRTEVPCCAIGPTTAASLARAGGPPITVARTPTFQGLADAVEQALHPLETRA